MSRLNEIEARANAATEGPWEWDPQDGWLGTEDEVTVGWKWGTLTQEGDGQFIAHARTDVPALVAALRAVLELHAPTPSDIYPHDVCHHPHCTDPTDQMEQSPWPCPTVTAIRQHLGDDL